MPRFFALYEAPAVSRQLRLTREWFSPSRFAGFEGAGRMTGVIPPCVLEIGECEIQENFGNHGYVKVWLTVEAENQNELSVEKLGLLGMLEALAHYMGNGQLCTEPADWWMNQASELVAPPPSRRTCPKVSDETGAKHLTAIVQRIRRNIGESV